jgi:Protein of unknown function (DUF2934)
MKTSDFTIHVLDIEDRKRRIAFALWEEEGRPDGRAEAHWQEACRLVEAELQDPEWLKRSAAESEPAEPKRSRRAA